VRAEEHAERLRAETEALLKEKSRRVEEDKDKQAAIDKALAAIATDLRGKTVEETVISLEREVGRLREVVNRIREFVFKALGTELLRRKLDSGSKDCLDFGNPSSRARKRAGAGAGVTPCSSPITEDNGGFLHEARPYPERFMSGRELTPAVGQILDLKIQASGGNEFQIELLSQYRDRCKIYSIPPRLRNESTTSWGRFRMLATWAFLPVRMVQANGFPLRSITAQGRSLPSCSMVLGLTKISEPSLFKASSRYPI
jgi:hypothetical protein